MRYVFCCCSSGTKSEKRPVLSVVTSHDSTCTVVRGAGSPLTSTTALRAPYTCGSRRSGNESVSLSVNNLPAHNHLYAGDDQVSYIHDGNYNAGNNVVSRPGGYDAKSENSGAGTIYRTSNAGSGQSFSIMPPYYKLAFIMRVK